MAGDCNSLAETHAWFDSRVAHHFFMNSAPYADCGSTAHAGETRSRARRGEAACSGRVPFSSDPIQPALNRLDIRRHLLGGAFGEVEEFFLIQAVHAHQNRNVAR